MTRRPVTVTEDQMQLIDGATDLESYSSRSAVVRNAFLEYFGDNEVLLAVLLASLDDVDIQEVVSTVDADPDTVTENLTALGASVDDLATASILEKIQEDIPAPGNDDFP